MTYEAGTFLQAAEAAAKAAEEAGKLVASLPAGSTVAPRPNERLGFGLDDVEGQSRDEGLYVGDKVELRLAVERAGGARGATALRLVAPAWRRGFVAQVKDGPVPSLYLPCTFPVPSCRR